MPPYERHFYSVYPCTSMFTEDPVIGHHRLAASMVSARRNEGEREGAAASQRSREHGLTYFTGPPFSERSWSLTPGPPRGGPGLRS